MLQQLYLDMGIAPSEFVKAKIRTASGLFQRNSGALRGRGSFRGRGGYLTRRRRRYMGGGLEEPESVSKGTQSFINEYLGSTFKKMWSRR